QALIEKRCSTCHSTRLSSWVKCLAEVRRWMKRADGGWIPRLLAWMTWPTTSCWRTLAS
ncbi:hypothetical protein GGI23_003314, partial [Coemansia sp. RSA 2559]